jgi:hypothetical protein
MKSNDGYGTGPDGVKASAKGMLTKSLLRARKRAGALRRPADLHRDGDQPVPEAITAAGHKPSLTHGIASMVLR